MYMIPDLAMSIIYILGAASFAAGAAYVFLYMAENGIKREMMLLGMAFLVYAIDHTILALFNVGDFIPFESAFAIIRMARATAVGS